MSSATHKPSEATDLAAKMLLGARRLQPPPAEVMQPTPAGGSTLAPSPAPSPVAASTGVAGVSAPVATPAVAAVPVMTSVPAPAPATAAHATTANAIGPAPDADESAPRRATRRPRESPAVERELTLPENAVEAQIAVDPGKATCTLSVRVPRKLRAELNLLAMQARYGNATGPATVNDLVLEAIESFLHDRRKQRAA